MTGPWGTDQNMGANFRHTVVESPGHREQHQANKTREWPSSNQQALGGSPQWASLRGLLVQLA